VPEDAVVVAVVVVVVVDDAEGAVPDDMNPKPDLMVSSFVGVGSSEEVAVGDLDPLVVTLLMNEKALEDADAGFVVSSSFFSAGALISKPPNMITTRCSLIYEASWRGKED